MMVQVHTCSHSSTHGNTEASAADLPGSTRMSVHGEWRGDGLCVCATTCLKFIVKLCCTFTNSCPVTAHRPGGVGLAPLSGSRLSLEVEGGPVEWAVK